MTTTDTHPGAALLARLDAVRLRAVRPYAYRTTWPSERDMAERFDLTMLGALADQIGRGVDGPDAWTVALDVARTNARRDYERHREKGWVA